MKRKFPKPTRWHLDVPHNAYLELSESDREQVADHLRLAVPTCYNIILGHVRPSAQVLYRMLTHPLWSYYDAKEMLRFYYGDD